MAPSEQDTGDRRHRSRHRRERKEHVLHTRISEELAEDIRRMADDLRVPVSNIVRTVLEEAFSAVEKVSENVGDLIEEVVDEAEAASERIRRRHRHRRHRHRRHAGQDARADDPPVQDGPRASAAEAESSTAESEEVIGWQPLFLAQPRRCGSCGQRVERGGQAFAATTVAGLGAAVLCEPCMEARRRS